MYTYINICVHVYTYVHICIYICVHMYTMSNILPYWIKRYLLWISFLRALIVRCARELGLRKGDMRELDDYLLTVDFTKRKPEETVGLVANKTNPCGTVWLKLLKRNKERKTFGKLVDSVRTFVVSGKKTKKEQKNNKGQWERKQKKDLNVSSVSTNLWRKKKPFLLTWDWE